MKRLLLLVCLLSLVLVGCSKSNDPAIIGTWGTFGIPVYTFTQNGKVDTIAGMFDRYETEKGIISFWKTEQPEEKALFRFKYTIIGNTMTLQFENPKNDPHHSMTQHLEKLNSK